MEEKKVTVKEQLKRIDEEIYRALGELNKSAPGEERRRIVIDELTDLSYLKKDLKPQWFKPVDLATVAQITLGVVVISGVLNYEKENVITTRAFDIGRRIMGI